MCQNQIVNLVNYIKHHLERCTSYCICCGKKLADEAFRISPCTAEFCLFKFEEIFGVKLCSELQNNFDLIELDLSIANKAIFSNRAYDIFEPFPSFFLLEKENRLRSVFAKDKIVEVHKENKNINLMRDILSQFPELETLRKFQNEDDLKKFLPTFYKDSEESLMAYKLITYIIATNRLSLLKLESETDKINGIAPAIIQFIVTNQNPEFERKFDILKKKVFFNFLIFKVWICIFISWV